MKVFVPLLRAACVRLLVIGHQGGLRAQSRPPRFHVIALAEKGRHSQPFVDGARYGLPRRRPATTSPSTTSRTRTLSTMLSSPITISSSN